LEIRPKKRVFIGLLLFICLIFSFLFFILWYVPLVALKNIYPSLPLYFGVALAVVVFLVCSGGLLLVFIILSGKDIFFSHRFRGVVVKALFPVMILMGRLLGVSKEGVQQSFLEFNNKLVRSNSHRVPPHKLLILLPQCIQDFDCQIRITGNIRNCKGCGKCQVKDLIALSDQYGVKIAVATGGTLARKIVVENRPEAIVAVACELDLTSGIRDTYPIPAIGILNDRPNGPCISTKVDLQKVRDATLYFLDGKWEMPSGPTPA